MKRLSREIIHQSNWVNLYIDKVQFPNGHIIEKFYLLDFDWSAVITLPENAAGDLLFVRVYRYTTDSLGWELPAGRIETGEDIVDAAQREVLEETGYLGNNWKHIYSYTPLSGLANQVFNVVHCNITERIDNFDRSEVVAIRWFTKEEIRKMIEDKTITEGFTLTALLIHFMKS